jgi:hypothetical protein
MGLRLFFLPKFPGATFIQGGTFIPDSRAVKTSIFDCRKIAFERELASYWPVFLHYSWIFDSGTLIQIVSAGILC